MRRKKVHDMKVRFLINEFEVETTITQPVKSPL
jgi:hypothetical protein